MARIAVIGGTGYAGQHITREAVNRGHDVLVVSRRDAEDPVAGARYAQADLQDTVGIVRAVGDVDVVFSTTSPRGEMAGKLRPAVAALVSALPAGVRFGVVGGAGGSHVSEDGPLLIDTDEFPEEIKPEAREMMGVLDDLRATDASVDWFFVHPAQAFGAWAPGERTGAYRTGGAVLVRDADGNSSISGADFAVAVVDEIETPRHRRQNFSTGY